MSVPNYKRFFMRSGGCLDFSRETLDFFPLEDVLYAMGRERRFFNQIDWSVLQHSIACGLASELLYNQNILLVKHTYVHDFPEAFIRDVPAVVKVNDYKVVEYDIERKIHSYLGLPALSSEDHAYLKEIDLHMRLVESFHLYQTAEAFDCISEETENLNAAVLIACCRGFELTAGMEMFVKDDLNPAVGEMFRAVLARF